ncbi:MAG TPA: carboxypeptidase-like regulatory domain-containing protein, partial [Pyrinomonadaceae bacterium]|nr:carboxypeptidase-like regulatory domain-containing protein [Pyrinomonadaceae bacterium]
MKRSLVILLLCATATFAQRGTSVLKGQVADEFGGVIVGATVTAIDSNGATKTATTTGDGAFTFTGLAPGKYTVRVAAPGFATFESTDVEVT